VDHCRAVPTTGLFGKHSYWVHLLNVSMVIVNSLKIRALAGPSGDGIWPSAHQALLCRVSPRSVVEAFSRPDITRRASVVGYRHFASLDTDA
jgi:hypothetical protein